MSADVDMVTLEQVKTALELDGDDHDSAIPDAITAASRAINSRYRRELTPRADDETRTFSIRETQRILDFRRFDLRSASVVTVNPGLPGETTLTQDVDYTPWPITPDLAETYLGLRLGRSFAVASTFQAEFGALKIAVTGDWGAWDTADVPEDLKRACIVTVGSWVDKAVAAYGDMYDDGRGVAPGFFATLAIPRAAWSLLQDLGLARMTAV